MTYPHPTPPATQEALRADLDDILNQIVAERGPNHPMAQVVGNALLRGDHRALKAAWCMYHSTPARDA